MWRFIDNTACEGNSDLCKPVNGYIENIGFLIAIIGVLPLVYVFICEHYGRECNPAWKKIGKYSFYIFGGVGVLIMLYASFEYLFV